MNNSISQNKVNLKLFFRKLTGNVLLEVGNMCRENCPEFSNETHPGKPGQLLKLKFNEI